MIPKIFRKVGLLGLLIITITLASCENDIGTRTEIGFSLANPIDIAFPDGTTMYVANANQSQEFFIDASVTILNITNPIAPVTVNAIQTPLFNGRMATNQAVLPNQLFLTNRLSDDDLDFTDPVFVYNTTNSSFPTVPLVFDSGDDPFGIAIAPAGAHMGNIFVSHISVGVVNMFNPNTAGDPVDVIDLTTSQSTGSFSSDISISPDGAFAVVTNVALNALYIIDLTPPDDLTVEATFLVRNSGFNIADFRESVWIDPTRFVVANRQIDAVFVFDLATVDGGAPLADDGIRDEIIVDVVGSPGVVPIPLTPFGDPTSLAISGNRLFVGEFAANFVNIINLNTLVVEKQIFSGGFGPAAVRFEPGGRYLYVANQLSSGIGIIDSLTDTLVGTFP